MRVMIVGTYRDSELSNADALVEALAAFRRLEGVSRIDLVGLDDTGVVALMEAGAGHPLDDAAVGLAHAIYRETDGNPFFVSEVLRNLVETGAIGQDAEGHWVAEDSLDTAALPDSVREVIGARVLRLGKDAGRVLSVAAVVGRDFDLDLLARATRTDEADLLDILDAAAAVALVREVADSGRYTFAHALIQHTLYEDLGHNRRARAHRQVAEALEVLCGDRPGARVGELARHWIAATQPIDLAKAVSYSRQAGDAALAALAPADALRYYTQALDLYTQVTDTDPVVGIDLSIGLGTAQRQIGDPAYRDTLLGASRRAADLGDAERLVAAALANNRGWVSNAGATDAEKVEILELALDRVSADDPDRALVLATLHQEIQFGEALDRREALAQEAVAIARSSGDDATIVRVFNSVSYSAELSQALAWSADALVRAERIGDPVLLFLAADGRLSTASRLGDIDEIDRCLEIMGSTVEKLGQPTLDWRLMHTRATRAQIAGDPERAEELATEAFKIGTDGGEPDAALIFSSQMAVVTYQRGTMGELVPFIKEAAAENPGLPVLVAALTMAYVEGDQIDHARQLLDEFAATDFYLPMNSAWLTGMVAYGGAAIECRDPKFALPLFDRLAPWADEWSATGGPTVEGPVSHTLGGLATLLGRYDEADAYFAHSAASSERANAKFFAARTYLLWGRMFAQRVGPGDVEKAHDLLTKAHTAAAANGYGTVERRAATALRDLVVVASSAGSTTETDT
jgi:tetratricopeptide (TPR) repeat protein